MSRFNLSACRLALFLCALPAPCGAQLLRPTSVAAAPGETKQLEIVLDPTAAAISALQWEITLPARGRGVELQLPRTGAAAQQAEKTCSCTGVWKKAPVSYTYRCLVAGGRRTIGSGPVAIVALTVTPQAKPGSYPVEIENARAVNAAGVALPLKTASAKLDVKAPEAK